MEFSFTCRCGASIYYRGSKRMGVEMLGSWKRQHTRYWGKVRASEGENSLWHTRYWETLELLGAKASR
mgnify:FL=1